MTEWTKPDEKACDDYIRELNTNWTGWITVDRDAVSDEYKKDSEFWFDAAKFWHEMYVKAMKGTGND